MTKFQDFLTSLLTLQIYEFYFILQIFEKKNSNYFLTKIDFHYHNKSSVNTQNSHTSTYTPIITQTYRRDRKSA